MKVGVEFEASFEDQKILPIQLGRLYLGQHVVRLAFTPEGKTVMLLPKSAIDDGHVIVSDDYKDVQLTGFGYPPAG